MDVLLSVVPDSAASAEERERLARRLLAELRGLDLHTLQAVADGAPREGSKGVTAGAVVLALSVPGGVLTSLIGLVQDWLGRQVGRNRVSITLDGDTLDLPAPTPEERQQLIDAFVRRHGAGGE
ncbi:hypothetical protein ACFY6U_34645 [Streptomyces sp. NPDC013157]|uniref:effector-associated constant component EACC1 n=1 Tax=Streptomyces sp. NPDC013157 TaxID=3364861 RepID=UPI0036A18313